MGRKKKESAGSGAFGAMSEAAETKEAKFIRLAQRRVSDALRRISRIKNLANASQYAYTPEQTDKIVVALCDAVEAVGKAFAGSKEQAAGFTF